MKKAKNNLLLFLIALSSSNLYCVTLPSLPTSKTLTSLKKQFDTQVERVKACAKSKKCSAVVMTAAGLTALVIIGRLYYVRRQTAFKRHSLAAQEAEYKQKVAKLDEQINAATSTIADKLATLPKVVYQGQKQVSLNKQLLDAESLSDQARIFETNKDWENVLLIKKKILDVLQRK